MSCAYVMLVEEASILLMGLNVVEEGEEDWE